MKTDKYSTSLQKILNIYPGEAERVILMFICSVMTMGGVMIIGYMVGQALFVGTLPESDIAYRYIFPSLIVIFVISIYTRMSSFFRRDKLIFTSFLLMIAGIIIFRILIESELKESFIFLLTFDSYIEVIVNVTIIQFWMFAGDLFTTREAKRLFGLIAGGSLISSILFGAIAGSISDFIQTKNLMFVVLISLLICFGIIFYLNGKYNVYGKKRNFQLFQKIEDNKVSHNIIEDMKQVFGHKLIIYLSLILISITIVSRIGWYQFDLAMKDVYGSDTQKMVGFFGNLQFVSGIIGLIVQIFIGNRIINKFGIFPALLIFPAVMAGGSISVLLTGGVLLAVSIPIAAEGSLRYSLNESAINLLYLPIPSALRAKSKAILEGMIMPAAATLLGLIFLLISKIKGISLLAWSPPMLALTLVWIIMLLYAFRCYIILLGDSIKERRLNVNSENLDLSDEMSRSIVVKALKDEDPMRVLHVLGLIRKTPSINRTSYLSEYLSELLTRQENIIKIESLKYIRDYGDIALAANVRPLFMDTDLLVRKEALLTFCSLTGKDAVKDIKPFLNDELSEIQSASIIALVKYCGLAGLLHASSHLQQLLESPEPSTRIEAIRILESLGVASFYDPLIKFIDDSDIQVQLSAVKAAQSLCAPELIPHLYKKLDSPIIRQTASEAIIKCAEKHPEIIARLIDKTKEFPFIRKKLVQVAEKQGTLEDKRFIVSLIDDRDNNVRSAVYLTLIKLRMIGYLFNIRKEALIKQFNREIKNAYKLYILRLDIKMNKAEDKLLKEAIEKRETKTINRIISLVVLLYPRLPSETIRSALLSGDPVLKSNVIELLDNTLEKNLKTVLIPYLDGSADKIKECSINRFNIETSDLNLKLQELLIQQQDEWLKACALYYIAKRGYNIDIAVLEGLIKDDNSSLVQEMLEYSLKGKR